MEIWTQSTGIYSSGTKVAEGSLDSPISLSPGTYQAVLKGSLPSPYNATKQVPLNCVFFSISSSQSTGVTCTLEAYNKNDTSNYNLPSSERPSGAPPMVEVDSSLGSYQFVKNVVDISEDGPSSSITSIKFATLYGKKVMLIGTRKYLDSSRRYEYKLSIYDIANPFNPQLLKENTFSDDSAEVKSILLGAADFSQLTILDNHPVIYGRPNYAATGAVHVFVKINPDWSLGDIQDFDVKESGGSISNKYVPTTLFRGLDGKPYALAYDTSEGYGCNNIKILDVSSSTASIIGEIKESELNIGYCESGIDYNNSKSIRWFAAQPVRASSGKLYLVIPTDDAVARLHTSERAWISVFDVSNPSNPQFVGKWQMSGLNGQLHFPDASESEKAKIYADAGLIEVDPVTGYVYDIFPHMYDFQNGAYMTSGEAVNAFNKISGPWRYRNGIIIRKLNNSGNFDFVYRATLCETEGSRPSGSQSGSFHRVECGDQAEWWGNKTFDEAFYGIGGYITILPLPGTHAYNGLVLLRDLTKSSIEESGLRLGGKKIKMIAGSPVVVGLMTSDNKFKIIPDSSDEFLKFSGSLAKIISTGQYTNYGKYLFDAHLQQVDNKTFAIFQIHPTSIDVVKLTLTQPRPLPSSSPSFTPQATTMTLTTASATPSTGTSSSIQGTLYSIRSILNNLRRILSR
ncbi:MAG: hypothetical protein KatS3mg098_270 [Candidatus Parcubacteria bacterium]|nr:MAG: hypothetical protein KatS3mg098_270 [Candidatus Parcubacteria bacterium]